MTLDSSTCCAGCNRPLQYADQLMEIGSLMSKSLINMGLTRGSGIAALNAQCSNDPGSLFRPPSLSWMKQDRISYINAEAQQFFKSSTHMLLNQPIAKLVPFGSPVLEMIGQVRRDGVAVWEYEVNLSTPHTGERIADVQVAPIGDDRGACSARAA